MILSGAGPLALWPADAFASPPPSPPPVRLQANIAAIPLGFALEYYVDRSSRLDLADIRAPDFAGPWIASAEAAPNFGFTDATVWLRFRVENPAAVPQERILDIEWDIIDRFQIYGHQGPALLHSAEHGRALPFRQRPVGYRNFALPLDFPPGESVWHLRLQSSGPLTLPMTLRSSADMIARVDRESLFYGAIFGTLAVLAVYNFALFFAIRDRAYLEYAAFILVFALTEFHNKGFALQYLQPEWIWSTVRTSSFLRWIEIMLAAQFYRSFTRTPARHPRLDRSLQLILAAAAAGAASSLWLDIRLADTIGLRFFALSALYLLGATLYLTARRNRQATIYLAAFGAIILGAVATSLRSLGLAPYHFLTAHSILIGSAVQAAVLSLGLADRYRQMRAEADAARLKLTHDRMELSRELHDVLGSDLGEIVIHAESHAADGRDAAGSNAVAFLARRSLAHLRDIVRLLKVNADEIEPLHVYMQQYVDRLRLTGRFRVDARLESVALPDYLNLQAQRIFLEWMANVVRHARAGEITTALRRRRGRLALYVIDDGVEFNWNGERTGSGLAHIADRARGLHARVRCRRIRGRNCFVCRMPLPASAP